MESRVDHAALRCYKKVVIRENFRACRRAGARSLLLGALLLAGPASAAESVEDFAALSRYAAANAALGPDPSRIVFLGDSITEAWGQEAFFTANPHRVNRGIGGQTAPQMLLRFRSDVIGLQPALVHIMAGTNDVAGNAGPERDADIEGSIASMVELALAHRIGVIIASIPPAADFPWHPGLDPAPRIRRLNAWLKSYAERMRVGYVDYGSVLAAEDGAMKAGLSPDGVHPDSNGYRTMEPLANAAIAAALRTVDRAKP